MGEQGPHTVQVPEQMTILQGGEGLKGVQSSRAPFPGGGCRHRGVAVSQHRAVEEDAMPRWNRLGSFSKTACGHPGLEGSQDTRMPELASLLGCAKGSLQTASCWDLASLEDGISGEAAAQQGRVSLGGLSVRHGTQDMAEMLPDSKEQQ